MPDFPPVLPTVVDSPLPVEAVGTPSDATPEQEPDEVQQLGQLFGIDTTQFSTPEDARKAVQVVVERYAAAGMNLPPDPQQWSPPAATPLPEGDEEPDDPIGTFDNLTTDPATAKALKKLQAEVKNARQEAAQLKQSFEWQQQQAYHAQVAEVQRRADAAIDKLASAKYGVGGQQSFSQQVARQNLKRLSESLVYGMQKGGQPLPEIERVIQLAAFQDGGLQPAKPKQDDIVSQLIARQTNTPVAGLIPPSGTAAPPRGVVRSEKDAFLKNEEFMAGARQILNRNR